MPHFENVQLRRHSHRVLGVCIVVMGAWLHVGCHPFLDAEEYTFPADVDVSVADGELDQTQDPDVSPADMPDGEGDVSADTPPVDAPIDVPTTCEGLCPDGAFYGVHDGPLPCQPVETLDGVSWCSEGPGCTAICVLEGCLCGVIIESGSPPACMPCPETCGDGVCDPGEDVAGCLDCAPVQTVEQRLDLSETHGCSVEGAALRCWGANVHGELGRATTEQVEGPGPADIAASPAAVATGKGFTCVLDAYGAVRCVGANESGQLGGTPSGPNAPVHVPLTDGAVQVVAGEAHACALTVKGDVLCWGSNADQQLGPGNTHPSAPISVLEGATMLAAGQHHTCAIDAAGAVLCWGANSAAQLGNGTNTASGPAVVEGIPAAIDLAAGFAHTCAVVEGGELWCWGDNSRSQIGGEPGGYWTPVQVEIAPVDAVAAGSGHTCVVSSGEVWCWGSAKRSGVPLDLLPSRVAGLSSVVDLVIYDNTTCARDAAGLVRCWGDNSWGQAGKPVSRRSLRPVKVAGLTNVSSVSAGDEHTCAVANGVTHCWGANGLLQLGGSQVWGSAEPAPVEAVDTVFQSVSTGPSHTCASTETGTWCWGSNANRQSATVTTYVVDPAPLQGALTQVVVGGEGPDKGVSCAIETPSGAGRCWGTNTAGQLGATVSLSEPPPGPQGIFTSHMVTTFAVGGAHVCAIAANGDVTCAGSDSVQDYAAGDGPIAELHGSQDISAGVRHTCVVDALSEVQCWGSNIDGQLGTVDTTLVAMAPTQVGGLPAMAQVAAGGGNYTHTCGLSTAGDVWCWGANHRGQLGRDTTSTLEAPGKVPAPLSFGAITTGGKHTCAIAAGEVWCWGDNLRGQLGDRSPLIVREPTVL